MDRATFWATKSPLPEWHAVVFEHPAFSEPIRLVANQFAEVTLGGAVHAPAPMSVKDPDQKTDAQPRMTIVFPRAVVGREFKRQLKRIVDAGSRVPITVTHAIYLGQRDTPGVVWTLYASDSAGVLFTPDSVQVTATEDNPMRRAVAPIYEPADFTGLELI